MKNFLDKLGHNTHVIVPNDYPEFLKWMKSNNSIINFSSSKSLSQNLVKDSDIIFCLDFNNLNRINDLGELINDSSSKKVLIDHHLEPDNFYDFKIHDVEASATAELIYDLLIDLDSSLIDKDISECIYTGILTDTGSFKFSSTSSKVHKIVADLIDRGINISDISNKIYDNNSIDKLKLIGFSLSQKLELTCDGRVAYIVLSRQDLIDHNFKKGDTEGLVNYALSIKNVNFASIIIEEKELIKFSFRSVGRFSVNDFAKNHFNGGGHKNAAGGRLDENLDVALSKFLKLVRENKQKLIY